MGFSIATAAVVFGLIFLVELPDKTFVATLVLSTRFRPLLVWVGRHPGVPRPDPHRRQPRRTHRTAAPHAGRDLRGGDVPHRRRAPPARRRRRPTRRRPRRRRSSPARAPPACTGGTSSRCRFSVLFLAEWGDLSQILTASLVLRYHEPLSVFVGAFLALATVSALGAVARPGAAHPDAPRDDPSGRRGRLPRPRRRHRPPGHRRPLTGPAHFPARYTTHQPDKTSFPCQGGVSIIGRERCDGWEWARTSTGPAHDPRTGARGVPVACTRDPPSPCRDPRCPRGGPRRRRPGLRDDPRRGGGGHRGHGPGVVSGHITRGRDEPGTGAVVLIGTGGLTLGRREPRRTTPNLWTLLRDGSSAAMSIRSVYTNTCPIDGWLGLSAGSRAAADRVGEAANPQYRPCPAIPEPSDGVIPGLARTTSPRRRDPLRLHRSAPSATRPPRNHVCIKAIGPGAGLGGARSNGTVERYSVYNPAHPAHRHRRLPHRHRRRRVPARAGRRRRGRDRRLAPATSRSPPSTPGSARSSTPPPTAPTSSSRACPTPGSVSGCGSSSPAAPTSAPASCTRRRPVNPAWSRPRTSPSRC